MIKVARNATHTCLIYDDPTPDNPRDTYEPFGHMVCWHRRYDLGDKHTYESPDGFLEAMCRRYVPDFTCPEKLTLSAKLDLLAEVPAFVILPLYLFDHSGLSISTTSFNDPWDSGQVGWIYATPDDLRENFMREPTDQDIWNALPTLRQEVNEYDLYLRGFASCFELYENDGVQIDACSNIFCDINPEDHICKNYLPSDVDFRADDFEDYLGNTFDYLSEHNML